jgi:hypothetical protein
MVSRLVERKSEPSSLRNKFGSEGKGADLLFSVLWPVR